MKKAFTLAEVLITLVVIGIAAALVIPSLVANYKARATSTALKKFYSSMQEAILLSEAENGPVEFWEMGRILDEDGKFLAAQTREGTKNYYNNYLAKYLKTLRTDEDPEPWLDADTDINHQAGLKVYNLDGSVFFMFQGDCMDFHIDVNGEKKPNEYGKDRFGFVICPEAYHDKWCNGKNEKFCSLCLRCPTREIALQKCKTTPSMCSRLLLYDGFEFKKDYPYKL